MKEVNIRDEFIKLGQALKLSGLAESGVDAKFIVEEGDVKVNGETETRRGRKLYNGDVVQLGNEQFTIKSPFEKQQ